jgi:thioredoxin 1
MNIVMKSAGVLVTLTSLLAMTACANDAVTTNVPEVKAKTEQVLPKLVDLGAKACVPCKRMAPILDELAAEYKGVFDVEFIDVWKPENQEKAKTYGIKSIPTQIFLDAKGKELGRHEGFIAKEDILKKWQDYGFTFKPAKTAEGDVGMNDPTGLAPVVKEVK